MRLRLSAILAGAALCLAPATSFADLGGYSQDFEGLNQADPGALGADGWLVFGNVFFPNGAYFFGYGPFPAPNGGPGFSAIDAGQGGPEQGAQQLVVYSDYNNGLHGAGFPIEANVFQEQVIGADDVGTTWVFRFDARRGNIEGSTTALAFFKTLDPASGFALTNFIWADMTNVPNDWDTYSLSIDIDAGLVGQILQFGYLNTATFFQGSGVFYDNIDFFRQIDADIKAEDCPNPIDPASGGKLPVSLLGTDSLDVSDIDPASVRLEGVPASKWGYKDEATPFGGDLCGCNTAGADGALDLNLKFDNKAVVSAIGADPGERVLTVTGTLLDGTPFEAQDCVTVVISGD